MFEQHHAIIVETADDYRNLAALHEAAAERFSKPGLESIAADYREHARRNRALAAMIDASFVNFNKEKERKAA